MVTYMVAMVGIGVSSLVFVSPAARGGASVIVALVLVSLVALFSLVMARVYLVLIALLFRSAENTSVLAAAMGGPPAAGPGPGSGYGPQPGPRTAPARVRAARAARAARRRRADGWTRTGLRQRSAQRRRDQPERRRAERQ